MASCQNR